MLILKDSDDLSKSPPGEYSDEFPIRGVNTLHMDKPPYLPPQLLNIVLNKDTAVRVRTYRANILNFINFSSKIIYLV